MESFFGRMRAELIYAENYTTATHVYSGVFEYIEVFYNRIRRHSSLGYKSPSQFEEFYYANAHKLGRPLLLGNITFIKGEIAMNYRNASLMLMAASILTACAPTSGSLNNSRPVNAIPMYGYPEIEKSEKLKKADEKFINGILSSSGDSRENVSKEVSAIGWIHFQKGDFEGAMHRFNQAWLLNPNNYDAHWGFSVLMLRQDKGAEASTHGETALILIDDNSKKPRLLSDIARTYSSQATIELDAMKRAVLFEKANSKFSEAIKLDPKYGNAYRAWALSLYLEGNYKKAWEIVDKHRALGGDSLSPSFIDSLSKKMPEPK